jgi:hypothetical protein
LLVKFYDIQYKIHSYFATSGELYILLFDLPNALFLTYLLLNFPQRQGVILFVREKGPIFEDFPYFCFYDDRHFMTFKLELLVFSSRLFKLATALKYDLSERL